MHIGALPPAILAQVFGFVDVYEYCNQCRLVNTQWFRTRPFRQTLTLSRGNAILDLNQFDTICMFKALKSLTAQGPMAVVLSLSAMLNAFSLTSLRLKLLDGSAPLGLSPSNFDS